MCDNGLSVIIRDLVMQFGDFRAVDNISLDIEKGEIFGFLGPNGAGKSTTIKMLTGLLIPCSGSAVISGMDIYRDTERIRENIGYMSQKFSLYDDLTVSENIDFYSGIYKIPGKLKKERKEWVIHISGIQDYLNSMTADLSLGLKQRLALGCAIMHKPPVIFLDEPTSGVDPISRRKFWDVIHDMAMEKKTVFVTTHYMDEADYCNRLALIYRGKIIAEGSPDMLRNMIRDQIIFEIISDESVKIRNLLEKEKYIKEIFYYGQGIHIIPDSKERAQTILDTLRRNNITYSHHSFKAPSLENVFVSLINRERK